MASLVYAFTTFILVLVSIEVLRHRRRRQYPPGPPGYPLVGNLLDIPPAMAFKKFKEWSTTYKSDVLHLDVAGKSIIVLSSMLLQIFWRSDRPYTQTGDNRTSRVRMPQLTMACELMQGNRFLALAPYGDAGRRLMQKHLAPSDEHATQARQIEFVRRFFLPSIKDSPDAFLRHIRNLVGGTMLSIAYGLPIKRRNDPWIKLAEDTLAVILSSVIPGRFIVDFIPTLKYLPPWVPGAGSFHATAKMGRDIIQTFVSKPYEAAKQEIASGRGQESLIYSCIENGRAGAKESDYPEDIVADLAGMIFAGGTDSTSTSIINFVLAMLLYPEVQKKAQAEIDAVVGRARLPQFADKAHMPYVAAVMKEVLRWRPVVPAGNAHSSTRDDTYKEYVIPKGSIIIANAWAMLHDENTYSDPEVFDPERYLNADGQLSFDVPDPDEIASFGFGRRLCPGAHIGISSLWITAVSLLACFDIRPGVDDEGSPIPPCMEYLGKTVVLMPEPFNCRFIPRHEGVEALINAEKADTEYI